MILCYERDQAESEPAWKTDVYYQRAEERQLGLLAVLVVALVYVNLT